MPYKSLHNVSTNSVCLSVICSFIVLIKSNQMELNKKLKIVWMINKNINDGWQFYHYFNRTPLIFFSRTMYLYISASLCAGVPQSRKEPKSFVTRRTLFWFCFGAAILLVAALFFFCPTDENFCFSRFLVSCS